MLRGDEGADEEDHQERRSRDGRRLYLRGAGEGLKLALAFHLGRRTSEDASFFAAKLAAATTGNFQLSTDGFNAYPAAVEEHLGGRVDYGQIVKTFGPETVDSERRYSPPR